jgi:hypothetical protein
MGVKPKKLATICIIFLFLSLFFESQKTPRAKIGGSKKQAWKSWQ